MELSSERAQAVNLRAMEKSNPPKSVRVSNGARIAKATDVRSIRLARNPDKQVLFVYDDPCDEEPCHAVIRMDNDTPEEEVAGVLDKIAAIFRHSVKPIENIAASKPE